MENRKIEKYKRKLSSSRYLAVVLLRSREGRVEVEGRAVGVTFKQAVERAGKKLIKKVWGRTATGKAITQGVTIDKIKRAGVKNGI